MSKSVYSIVLSDDVVREVDREAYANGLSRSAMINRLLAEAVSYVTPEMRMREIFGQVERLLTGGGAFQTLLQPSESMMSLRSALSYKYNPTVRYSVELDPAAPGEGTLRVSLRSQSSALLLYLGQFFRLWSRIETHYAGAQDCLVEDGRFARRFRLPQGLGEPEQGAALAAYIRAMHAGMKSFFNHLDDGHLAAVTVERVYQDYLKQYPAL